MLGRTGQAGRLSRSKLRREAKSMQQLSKTMMAAFGCMMKDTA
jgi:hypothetical protein